MVETRAQRKRRTDLLATFLCPDGGHVPPTVPEDCPFGHMQSCGSGGALAGTTEPSHNLRPLPANICIEHISLGLCVNAVRCPRGFHPTREELEDLDAYLLRANPPLSSCSSQQQLDPSPTGGPPISRLPNKLLGMILERLSMNKLVFSAAIVSKRWRSVVCSIGHTKMSLYLGPQPDHIYEGFEPQIEKRFFGQMNLSTCTHFSYKTGFGTHLALFFPNVNSFVIDIPVRRFFEILPQIPVTQLTTLSLSHLIAEMSYLWPDEFPRLLSLLNQFYALKRLDLQVEPSEDRALSMAPLAETLARLEHFTCGIGCPPALVSNLGASCTRLCLGSQTCYSYYNVEVTLPQWHTINGEWLARVTHLSFRPVEHMDTVIEYLATHALSLQTLHLAGGNFTRMTSRLIGLLARRDQLTELDLSSIIFDIPDLQAAHSNFKLTQLVHLRSLTLELEEVVHLEDNKQPSENSQIMASVLSTISPNVQKLAISIWINEGDDGTVVSLEIVRGLEHHLDLFTQLQTHSFQRCLE